MQIKTLMRTRFDTVSEDLPLGHARAVMARARLRTLPVVRGDRLVGLLCGEDIAKASPSTIRPLAVFDAYADPDRLTVGAVMRAPLPTLHPGASVAEAARLLRSAGLDAAPVAEARTLVGLVTTRDLLAALGRLLGDGRPAGFEHILVVAGPGSAWAATAAIETGRRLARQHGARLTLLDTLPRPSRWLMGRPRPSLDASIDRLRALAPDEPDPGLGRLVQSGEPVDSMIAAARELHADLIVLGEAPGRRRWFSRAGASEGLIRRAPCPVLLVPARSPRQEPGPEVDHACR
jgi:CBS domain-containing protein